RKQVETTGRFAEEDYTADGEQVKGRFKRRLEPPAPLGQSAHLAKLARPEGADPAGLAPVGGAQHQGGGFHGGHGAPWGRQGDKETRRQGDQRDRRLPPRPPTCIPPCLLVSLSPCLLVSPSPPSQQRLQHPVGTRPQVGLPRFAEPV